MRGKTPLALAVSLPLTLALAFGLAACKKEPSVTQPPDLGSGVTDPSGPSGGNGGGLGGGTTLQPTNPAAAELSGHLAALPEPEAVAAVWDCLAGYWVAEGGQYVGFVAEGGQHYIDYVTFGGEAKGSGQLASSLATDQGQATFVVRYDAMPATESSGAIPEHDAYVMLDASAFAATGQLKVLIADLGNGGWYQLSFGGATPEEAGANAR